MPLEVTEDEIRQMFLLFGEVMSVIIMDDKYIGSGQPRGYGYVQMPTRLEAQAAVSKLQDKYLRGQPMKVVEALPLSDSALAKPMRSTRSRFSNLKTRQR